MLARKLIEAALPLEAINEAAAREKSIRHGHPSTLHLWWARRPLAVARAVLFASIVDNPSDRPDLYPTVEEQQHKKTDLFNLIKRMVQWENSNDEELLKEIRAEIKKSVGERPIDVLDPFAGGGTIPLEAQRLGLNAHATDLNPVAVLINKAMIELPARFKNKPPVNPDAQKNFGNDVDWHGAQGLAADVEYYGRRLKTAAEEKIGSLYPTVKLDDDSSATVIAWLWSRTVRCNNPACEKIFPLAHSFVLSKKQKASVKPVVEGDQFHFEVEHEATPVEGTITRTGAKCIHCGADVKFEHIRAEGKAGRLGARLMAIVAEGKGKRIYLPPTDEHARAAEVEAPEDTIDAPLPEKALGFSIQNYGFKNYNELFTGRQLTALTTFSDLIGEVRAEVERDCGDKNYADAVATYLAFVVDKLSDWHSIICGWQNTAEKIRSTFSRPTLSMSWDFAEVNPFSNSSGCFDMILTLVEKCIRELPAMIEGEAHQHDANKPFDVGNVIVSTDPPYYDNIGYSDLSDFFYVWLRRSIKKIYPRLLMKMIPPKAEELISAPSRHDDKDSARRFFEDGMRTALKNIYEASTVEFPTTIYYAYKQDDKKIVEGSLSSGWETMLRSIVDAGFIIIGTWPLRTERPGRTRDNESNALSTSVVIVCRKPSAPKELCTYNRFLNRLSHDLNPKLAKLQADNLSPVDMAQAAIGPGMELYSQYSKIMRSDGRVMDIRSALRIINKALDEFLNSRDDELDNASKFCVELYRQAGFEAIKFGEAQILATAKNVSLTSIKEHGIIESGRGLVRLLTREELEDKNIGDCIWALAQRTVWWMEQEEGLLGCVRHLLFEHENRLELLKRMAYRLYDISDRRRRTEEAQGYSQIVDYWEDIGELLMKEHTRRSTQQQTLAWGD